MFFSPHFFFNIARLCSLKSELWDVFWPYTSVASKPDGVLVVSTEQDVATLLAGEGEWMKKYHTLFINTAVPFQPI